MWMSEQQRERGGAMAVVHVTTLTVKPDRYQEYVDQVARGEARRQERPSAGRSGSRRGHRKHRIHPGGGRLQQLWGYLGQVPCRPGTSGDDVDGQCQPDCCLPDHDVGGRSALSKITAQRPKLVAMSALRRTRTRNHSLSDLSPTSSPPS